MQARQQLAILIAASFATIGCASTAPAPDKGLEPERAPAPVVREQPGPTTTRVRASFGYSPGTVSYLVTSEATIAEMDSTAGAPRMFRQVARVVLTIAPADGQVLVTTTGSVEGTTTATVIHPFVDTLRADMSVDATGEPRMPICGRDTVPPMHLVTLLPPVPQELREGVRWQHRHVYASCQASIPVRVERTDSYVATGTATQIAGTGVTIARSSTLAYTGAGVEGQHNVRLTGSGSGRTTLILDASAGKLVNAVEEIVGEIEITASGRTRRFSQRITRTVQSQ